VDEVHAIAGTKRGAHLALSLERLERLVAGGGGPSPQRIGLSATQRPLETIARFLGGAGEGRNVTVVDAGATPVAAPAYRPVTIINAAEKKQLTLRIEVPVEDMARLRSEGAPARPAADIPSGPAGQPPTRASIWSSIHPRLLELIRSHQSTLLFVNSRRLAERLAGALNELAGEPLVRSHHGSLARAARSEVEDLLKAGHIKALVATSSRARPYHAPCTRARSSRRAIRAIRSTSSRSRSSRWRAWTRGTSTSCTPSSAAPRRSPT
jgi:ATP-dependent Lhr-like helicase